MTPSPSSVLKLIAYTDYKSPYAYVASRATQALALEYPVLIDWRPYTLRIAEYLDAVDSRSAHNWRKVKYAYMDARRLANRQGLTLMGPRRIYTGELCSLGMLFAQQAGFFAAYHEATFARFWRHELDIDSMDEMTAHIAALVGALAVGAFGASLGLGIQHRAIVEDAERRGVFGVPMIVFEDELFWGGDRIGLVRQAIEQRLGADAAARRAARGGLVR